MLVYGDRVRPLETAPRLAQIDGWLAQAGEASGIARHDLLTAAFVAGAELAQGLVDAEFAAAGEDVLTPRHRAALAYVRGLAQALAAGEPAYAQPLDRSLDWPERIEAKAAEGYAFYAVYPEVYRRAALAHAWPSPPLVIGLRSIGLGLAAVVAEAVGAADVVSVRPVGHPFERKVALAPALAARLAAHDGLFAIVDEGPGQSGSSFWAVAESLESLGVAFQRIVFLPSHPGDLGPQARPDRRARWAGATRCVATLDDLLETQPIDGWFEDITGRVQKKEDLSGGAWRAVCGDAPAWPVLERRKFRLTGETGDWMARFAGLGEIGAQKFARAQALQAGGFGPQTPALRRGFLLQRWEDGARLDRTTSDRPRFVAHLGRYLAFRARAFPADPEDGATPEALRQMAWANVGIRLAPPPRPGRRVHVDGRLQPWEWLLRRSDGGFIKLDALDHSCGHDLIGCQDIAWDVAGAEAEFALSPAELGRLIAIMAGDGVDVDADLLAFLRPCYAAFRAGLRAMAQARPPAA